MIGPNVSVVNEAIVRKLTLTPDWHTDMLAKLAWLDQGDTA